MQETRRSVVRVVVVLCWVWIILASVLKNFGSESILIPFVESFIMHNQRKISVDSYKTFAFTPGWAYNYLDRVDLTGLSAVAHYDLPVAEDGTISTESDGYYLFKSDKAVSLFQEAKSRGIKSLVTLSQSDPASIISILGDPQAQRTLINEAVTEVKGAGIDGVNLDFEFTGQNSPRYRTDFTKFVANFASQMHSRLPGSTFTVTLYPAAVSEPVYDIPQIAAASDQVFIEAYDFAAPEIKNGKIVAPLYGNKSKEYMVQLTSILREYTKLVPVNKLAFERAWYGNGSEYPLYRPDFSRSKRKLFDFTSSNTMKTPLSRTTIDQLVAGVPNGAKEAARNNLPIIATALEKEGILNPNVLAYALATIEHETAGTFEPIDEYFGKNSARRLGYEGGEDFFGRGFIQLTHLRNYKAMSERLGLGDLLVKDPNLVSRPEIAAAVLAVFFKENGVAESASVGDFVDARTPINPDYMGWQIATLTFKYII